jgi:hypothetical protein
MLSFCYLPLNVKTILGATLSGCLTILLTVVPATVQAQTVPAPVNSASCAENPGAGAFACGTLSSVLNNGTGIGEQAVAGGLSTAVGASAHTCQEFRAVVGHDGRKGTRPCRDAKNLRFLT